MFYVNLTGYIERNFLIGYSIEKLLNTTTYILGVAVITLTLIYLTNKRSKAGSGARSSMMYVWFSMFGVMVLINLIQNNILHSINFELQHSIFMVVIAYAIITTGNILKNRLLIYSGILSEY
jgi:hypothetical protein